MVGNLEMVWGWGKISLVLVIIALCGSQKILIYIRNMISVVRSNIQM